MNSVVHFSIDDFIVSFKDLTEKENQYDTLFAQPLFAFLQKMHNTYGAVFSCYCFGRDIKMGFLLEEVTQKYREEFSDNAYWLKFGFHGIDSEAVYGDNGRTRFINRNEEQAAEDYEYVVKQLVRIVGKAAIDEIPRIHFFAGTETCCTLWKNTNYGIKGLLSADDDRYSYYHDDIMRTKLIEKNYLYDERLQLHFFRTNIRLEKEENLKTLYEKVRNFPGKCQVIFTHEKYLERKEMQEKIELCAQAAVDSGKKMDFPINCENQFI